MSDRVLFICPSCDEEFVLYDPEDDEIVPCRYCGTELRLTRRVTWTVYEVEQ